MIKRFIRTEDDVRGKHTDMRIVIVEREAAVLEGLATIIHGTTPHSVVGKCRSGEEGLEAIQKQKPDLVITGIKLEGMDGLTMLQKLQDIGEDVIGIVVSTHTEFT